MNRDDFGDAMGKIDESIITMTDKKRNRRKKRTVIKICAVAACVALIIGVAFSAPNFPDSSDFNIISAGKVKAIEAEYPKMTQFPSNFDDETQSQYDKWYSELSERRTIKTEKQMHCVRFTRKRLMSFCLKKGKSTLHTRRLISILLLPCLRKLPTAIREKRYSPFWGLKIFPNSGRSFLRLGMQTIATTER